MPSVEPGCKQEVHSLYCWALCWPLTALNQDSIPSGKTSTIFDQAVRYEYIKRTNGVKKEGAYSNGSQKSVILKTMGEQKLLDLAPMIFEVLQGSLNLKLEQKHVFYKSTILYVTKQVDNEIC